MRDSKIDGKVKISVVEALSFNDLLSRIRYELLCLDKQQVLSISHTMIQGQSARVHCNAIITYKEVKE